MARPVSSPAPRSRRAFWALLGGLGGVLALAAILLNLSAPQAVSGLGGPFALQTGGGRVVTDRDLRGAPFLVFFGYTHCPDVCPTTLAQITAVLAALGPEARIKVLFVTVDPERDTPQLMADYASAFDSRVIGLSGDAQAVGAMLKAFRVYARKAPDGRQSPDGSAGYAMDHSALVYLMDDQGRFLRAFALDRPPEQAAAELKALISQ